MIVLDSASVPPKAPMIPMGDVIAWETGTNYSQFQGGVGSRQSDQKQIQKQTNPFFLGGGKGGSASCTLAQGAMCGTPEWLAIRPFCLLDCHQ